MPLETALRASRRHGARCGVLALLAACAALVAPASAAADPDVELATSATHALGVDATPGCFVGDQSGGNIQLTNDRGQTWSAPGACVAWDWTTAPAIDTTNGHLAFLGDGALTVLDGAG